MSTKLELDQKSIDQIVTAIVERLEGDWVLLGGALVALWLDSRRTTEDVDIVGLDKPAQRLALMNLAHDRNLPIEAVNSAADFFLERIPGWKQEIEIFRQGPRGKIWRPTPTLFLLLKARRLTDQDLSDCLAVIDRANKDHLRLDPHRVLELLDGLPLTDDQEVQSRRTKLRQALRAPLIS
jgi:predicted nucleotidyltransferase